MVHIVTTVPQRRIEYFMDCVLSNGTHNCVGLGLLCTRHFATSEKGQKLAVLTDGRHGFPQLHLASIRVIPQASHKRFFSWFFPVHFSQVFQLLYATFCFNKSVCGNYCEDLQLWRLEQDLVSLSWKSNLAAWFFYHSWNMNAYFILLLSEMNIANFGELL